MDNMDKTNTEHINRLKEIPLDEVYEEFKKIPFNERTLPVCWIAVQREPMCFEDVPQDIMTEELIKHAISRRGDNICWIPESQINDKWGVLALTDDVYNFSFIPDEKRTEIVCKKAIELLSPDHTQEEWKKILERIPYPELVLEGLFKAPNVGELISSFIKFRPEDWFNSRLVDFVVKNNPSSYPDLPEKYKTYDRAYTAVKQNGILLRDIPTKFRDQKLCKAAIEEHVGAYLATPLEIKDYNFLEWGVTLNPTLLEWALHDVESLYPINNYTYKRQLCKIAIDSGEIKIGYAIPYKDLWLEYLNKQKGKEKHLEQILNSAILDKEVALEFIKVFPQKFYALPREFRKCTEVAELAVTLNGYNLRIVPQESRTEKIFLLAIDKAPSMAKHLPKEMQTKDFCRIIVEKNPLCLLHIPEEFMDKSMCETAIDKTYEKGEDIYELLAVSPYPDLILKNIQRVNNIGHIESLMEGFSIKVLDEDLMLSAVELSADALKYLPEKLKTQEFYDKAFEANPLSIHHIPEIYKTPEMCLSAGKQLPYELISIPHSVANGNNIYSFNHLIQQYTYKTYPLNEIKDMYEGKPFEISNLMGMKKGNVPLKEVRFDKENFSIKPTTPKQKEKKDKKQKL